jgi:hypothetical protein
MPWLRLVLIAIVVLVCANALVYTAKSANPLVAADEWTFVDVIVRKADAGTLTVGDLFMKRNAVDHAQPLRKLVLLFHYRAFDLDFGIEAIVGVLAAFANLGLLWLVASRALRGPQQRSRGPADVWWQARPPAWDAPAPWLAFAALAAVYLSLNSPIVFGWPLLTLAYTGHAFILAFLCLAWRGYRRGDAASLSLLAAAALVMDLVVDDTGMIASVAALAAMALYGARERRLRAACKAGATVVAAYLGYALLHALLTRDVVIAGAQPTPPLSDMLGSLASHAGAMLSSLSVPLTASVAHRSQLHHWLGADTRAVELAIAAALALAHAWFWWKAWQGRRNVGTFAASALMLLFYGMVAGTLLVRVSLRGADYFWQPRYLVIYQWNLIALLLMAISQLGAHGGPATTAAADSQGAGMGTRGRRVLAACAMALLLVQLPFSVHSWRGVGYRSIHQQKMALQIGALADPRAKAVLCARAKGNCEAILLRLDLVRFLKARRLNVFSPDFRARNRLYADPRQLPD